MYQGDKTQLSGEESLLEVKGKKDRAEARCHSVLLKDTLSDSEYECRQEGNLYRERLHSYTPSLLPHIYRTLLVHTCTYLLNWYFQVQSLWQLMSVLKYVSQYLLACSQQEWGGAVLFCFICLFFLFLVAGFLCVDSFLGFFGGGDDFSI